jgi:hypothetical protein
MPTKPKNKKINFVFSCPLPGLLKYSGLKHNCIPGLAYILISLIITQCRQVYEPKIHDQNSKFLVVEGFINSNGPTVIHLSRTINFNDSIIDPELGASVYVEDENGTSIPLTETGNGEYNLGQLALDSNLKYRLYIKTANGKEYASEYSSVTYTPPIDSITWQRENDGLRLYTNAHDLRGAAKYYQWKFEETWEFHSAYYSSLLYTRDASNAVTGLVYRHPDHSVDTTIYKCWNTLNSTAITLGSTENLNSGVVYLPVQYIEPGSQKLSVLYSINLHQYAISHEEYLFLEKMKKNTEALGTLFDPQPSQLNGNIHCLSDPNEIVIGYIEVSQEQTKRLFIDNNQVNGWNYQVNCDQIEIANDLATINHKAPDLTPTIPTALSPLGGIISFDVATDIHCVYCTLSGTNQKPSYWP